MELVPEVDVQCPYCWETFQIDVDTTQGSYETIEDCSVCCRPMNIRIECEPGKLYSVEASP